MEAHQVKPDLKRHHGNDESEPNKRQRLDLTDEPKYTLKIGDLNEFCLIKIFENLNIRSLLNVAIANGRLRPAAIDVYQRKFGKNPLKICDFGHSRQTIKGQIHVKSVISQRRDGIIRITGLKNCLQFLRCFGSSVSDLTINYNDDLKSKRHECVNQYINDYCSDSLVRIRFLFMPNIAIGQLQKIFAKVQAVEIYGCHLGQQLSTFVKCFPNVRRFEASSSEVHDRFTPKPFQFLEHLSLSYIRCDGSRMSQFVANLLNGIRDLKSLELTNIPYACYDWPLLDLIKDNLSISKLRFSVQHDIIPLRSAEVQRIAVKHPALIELELREYKFTADDAIALVRQLKSLKSLVFRMQDLEYPRLVSQLDDEWEASTPSCVIILRRRI